ncbi:MAG TPA: tetratricopeptide repeat protein [Bacillota bacterium]|nr:tetratricopeptide repeat protein [Bacillota bacterium]
MDKNERALQLVKEKKYEEAAALYLEMIDERPDDVLGYINLGHVFLQVNEIEKSYNLFKKALEIDEDSATAHYGIGNCYFEQAKFPDARKHYEQAINQGLEDADTYFMLGMTFVHEEQSIFGIPYLLRATELNDADEQILFQYGLALAKVNYTDEAKEAFLRVMILNSKHPDALYNLGVIAVYEDKLDEGLAYFNRALASQPDHFLAANGKRNVEEKLK